MHNQIIQKQMYDINSKHIKLRNTDTNLIITIQ